MSELPVNAPQQTAPQSKRHPGRVIASVLLCILAFLLGTAACVLMLVHSITSEQVIETMVDNIDFNDIHISLGTEDEGDDPDPYGIAPASEEPSAVFDSDEPLTSEQESTLADLLHEKLNALPEVTEEISLDKVQQLLDQPFAKQFVSEKLSAFVDDFIHGTDTAGFTGEEVRQLLKDNYTVIEEILEVEIDPAMFDGLDVSAIDEIAKSISVSAMTEEIPASTMQAMTTVLSSWLAPAILGGAVLMLLLVCLIQRFKPVSLLYVGITVLAVAAVPFLIGSAMGLVNALLAETSVAFLTGAVVTAADTAMLYGWGLIAVGVLCIAAYIVLRIVLGRRAKATATV